MSGNNIDETEVGTVDDIHDTALYLMLSCGVNMGGNRSPLEMAGAALVAISAVVNEMIKNDKTGIIESESSEGTDREPEQV